MKMTGTVLAVMYFLAAGTVLSQTTGEKWLLKKESAGITVYERQGTKEAIKYVKARMTLQTSLSNLVALVMDVEGYPAWVDRTKESYLIGKESEAELYYRSVIEVPLLKNRDLVARLRVRQDKSSKVVTAEALGVAGKYPVDVKYERLADFQSTWRFVPLQGGQVQVEYVGAVPDDFLYGVVKKFIWNGLHQTFSNLRKLSGQQKDSRAASAFIVEPD